MSTGNDCTLNEQRLGRVRPLEVVSHRQTDWDRAFYGVAIEVGRLSKDPRRKVGAVVVAPDRRQMSPGYNGFPPEVPDTAQNLLSRDFCRKHMVHAEMNCMKQAAPTMLLQDATIYVTRFPCRECAEKIRAVGIARVVAPLPDLTHPRWGMSWAASITLLDAAGVRIHFPTAEEMHDG